MCAHHSSCFVCTEHLCDFNIFLKGHNSLWVINWQSTAEVISREGQSSTTEQINIWFENTADQKVLLDGFVVFVVWLYKAVKHCSTSTSCNIRMLLLFYTIIVKWLINNKTMLTWSLTFKLSTISHGLHQWIEFTHFTYELSSCCDFIRNT